MKARMVPIEIEIDDRIGRCWNADAIVTLRSKRLSWLAKLVLNLCKSRNVVIVKDEEADRRAWKLFGLHEPAES